MNVPVDQLLEHLAVLVTLYNKRSLDLPDGLFGRHTQFRLNGTAFEEMLGRSPDDPLVRMLTRGPAGYRFTLKALQHAVPDGAIEADGFSLDPDHWRLQGTVRITGHLRGTEEPFDETARVSLAVVPSGEIEIADAQMDPAALARLREARLRP